MESSSLHSPALSYERWYRHFIDNRDAPCALPWSASHSLSASELRAVTRSIQQFQLGEGARGRGFIRRASAHPVLAPDPWFVPSLKLFIAEEQRHSAILGEFLDRERIARLAHHWVDGIFRRLRKLAGLEMCAAVLVTAEVLAMSFYQALHDATSSPLLQSICDRILRDEDAHLSYQALTLGLIRRPLPHRAQAVRSLCHSMFFRATAFVLWQQHRAVFRAAGWDYRRFRNDARNWFALLEVRIADASSPMDVLCRVGLRPAAPAAN
jgi:hypothetical protein